jgi:3-hydroxyacyl-[acyl-carrier-protein] dehydratase
MRWFWIDHFVDFQRGKRAAAVKNITLVEEVVDEYIPGYPVFPNTLIIEGMAQTGGLLVAEWFGFEKRVVLGKVGRAEFFDPSRPGEQLLYRVQIENLGAEGASVSCIAEAVVPDLLLDGSVADGRTGSVADGRTAVRVVKRAEVEMFFAFLDDRFGEQDLIPAADLLTMCQLLRLYAVAKDEQGNPLPIAARLASVAAS